jgi:hypothetical protein
VEDVGKEGCDVERRGDAIGCAGVRDVSTPEQKCIGAPE